MAKQKILVPIESSAISEKAVEQALRFAEAGSAAVYLFVVGDPKQYGKLEGEALGDQLHEEIERMRDLLTSVIVRLSQTRELDLQKIGQVHHRFSVGPLDTEILKLAGAISSDIIMMGVVTDEDPDHGQGDFKFTPAFAGELVKRAPCSVYAIRSIDQIFVIV